MTPDLPADAPDRLVDALFLFLWLLGAVAVLIVLAGIASIFRRRARRAMGPVHGRRGAADVEPASDDAWSESGRRIAVAPEERTDGGSTS